MKYILVFTAFFILGCSFGGKKIEYLVTYPPTPLKVVSHNKSKIVGLMDIELPYYLQDGKLPYLKHSKVIFFDIYFANDGEEFFKKRALRLLLPSFKDVINYPWDNKKSNIIMKIIIKNLIANKNKITLDAYYIIYDAKKKVIKKEKFHNTLAINSLKKEEVLQKMLNLFDNFLTRIRF